LYTKKPEDLLLLPRMLELVGRPAREPDLVSPYFVVGSFNFDPRSARLNTEMGLVIHSPALARRLAESFDTAVPSRAYEVRLSADGELFWIERTPEGERRYDTEPGVGFFRRAGVRLLSILPIEREL
jgi:putative cardiolipin synthase